MGSEAPVYVKKEKHMPLPSRTQVPYEDYTMVQPALVIVHRSERVEQVWSWRTGTLASVEPKSEDTVVAGFGKLVGIRPNSADIPKAIKENRFVVAHGHSVLWSIREALREPKIMTAFGGVATVAAAI